jgi:hypothetical protein
MFEAEPARSGARRSAETERDVSVPCEDLNIWIERFRDGDLAGRALRDAQAHLDGCEACRERLTELEQVGTALQRALTEIELPIPDHELSQRISARLDALPALEPGASRADRAPWQYALAAAVAGFLMVGGLLWLDRARSESPVSGDMIASADKQPAPNDDSAETSVSVQLASTTSADASVRMVSSDDPDIRVVWIGNEGPQP